MPLVDTPRGKVWAAIHRRKHDAQSAIFIHGAGGSHLSFPASLRKLQSIEAILIDLPGHGASAGAGHSSIAAYALDVTTLMDALAIDSAILIGHSMGGAIAQFLALEHRARVRAIVLACTGARLPVNPALIKGIVAEKDKTIDNLSRWMWSKNRPADMARQTAEIMRGTSPSVFEGDLIACDNFDVSNRLGDIKAPTLILAGENDRMTPVALSQELEAGIPGSELQIIPSAGHMLQLEQPELTKELIDSWLRSPSL
ncbi:MAG: alpha/beta fold hydrolase [Chloroflexi bacterium]|nr:alpha/beta fold hydrolase [Chloroflexota bacterium]